MITYVGVSLPMGGDMSDVMKDYTYAAFELLIGNRTPEGYLATVVESPAGEGEALCVLHVDEELQDVLRIVEQGVVDEHYLAEFGAFLFSKLFTGDVASLYRTSLGMIRSQAKRLRIRLRIMPPELAALPWEYLLDLQEQSFLAISPETALVRYVPITLPVRPTTISPPLRVLVVIASPHDLQPLDVAHEKAILLEALDEWVEQGRIQVEVLERATAAEISQAMRRFQPHVFHFVGHGLFENETAYVVLEDESNNASLVDERTFREFFSGCQETRLAVLNACQSATLSTSQPLVGLAPRLLQRQLSAVVAMQHPVSDKAASIFTREFYRSLALGLPVDAAISEARKGIFLELGVQSPSWGTPVLFLRAKDGLLFQVAETAAQPLEIPPPPELVRPPEIPDFVGRDAELAYYAEKLTDAHLAVIAGMAGVGKTALAARLTERVARDRDRVFWHSFHEGEGIDAILWRLAGFLARHGRDELWRLLQSTRSTGGKPPPSETLFDYVLQLVAGSGFLFCFDDFHHVDEDPVLNQLVERLRSALVAGELSIILTSRRVPDFVTLAQFDPLAGLSYDDTRHLLIVRNLALTDAQTDQLYQYTAGNAEFLTLAIEALQRAASPDLLFYRLAESDDIERYLLQEVDEGLTGPERGVMNAVAVLLGYGGTRNAIEAVLNGGNIFRMLRRLTERHLLIVRDGEKGREYGQHAIVQAFYYEQTSVRERRAMHRRAGQFYETTEPDLLRAGIHFERAEEYEHAAKLATKDVWGIINQGQVRALCGLLERFEPGSVTLDTWVEIDLARGQSYAFLREREAAINSYQDALARLDALPQTLSVRERKARLCRGMGELLEWEDPQAALAWLQRGQVEAPEGSAEVAALYVRMGGVHLYVGDYPDAIDYLEQGLRFLPAGPSQLRGIALKNLSAVYWLQGDTQRAVGYAEEAFQISQQLHDSFERATTLVNLGVLKEMLGDCSGAIADFEQAIDLAKRLGSIDIQVGAADNLGAVYTKTGDDALAFQTLRNSLALAQQYHLHLGEAWPQLRLADLHIRRGEWMEAEQFLSDAEQVILKHEDKGSLVTLETGWAEVKAATGQLHAALEHAQQAIELAHLLGETIDEGIARRVFGQVLWASGRRRDAYHSFEESLGLIGDEDSYEAARTKMQMGLLLSRDAASERGAILLQEAQVDFERLGAKRDLALLAHEHTLSAV
jgi:ATP/maltotriose-dependent transcriptional regulator MalT